MCDHHLEEVGAKEEEKGLGCGEKPGWRRWEHWPWSQENTRLLTAGCRLLEAAGSQRLFARHQDVPSTTTFYGYVGENQGSSGEVCILQFAQGFLVPVLSRDP